MTCAVTGDAARAGEACSNVVLREPARNGEHDGPGADRSSREVRLLARAACGQNEHKTADQKRPTCAPNRSHPAFVIRRSSCGCHKPSAAPVLGNVT